MAASVASSIAGPTLLQVGERSPTDKKYQTREVLLAPPGTVVAPMPKGMEPTEENGLALVLAHLMKNAQAQHMQGMKNGGRVMRGAAWGENVAAPGPSTTAGPSVNLPVGTQSGTGSAVGTYYTSPYDPNAGISALNNAASTVANYGLSKSQQSIDRQTGYNNYQLALQKLAQDAAANQAAAANAMTPQKQALANSIQNSYNLSLSNSQNAGQQKSLDNALAIAKLQVAAQQAIAQMQNQLGYAGLGEQTRNDTLQNQIAQGQLAQQAAQQQFNQIMSGISEASVKRYTPVVGTTGLYQ